jgi:hypothetical protein
MYRDISLENGMLITLVIIGATGVVKKSYEATPGKYSVDSLQTIAKLRRDIQFSKYCGRKLEA